MSEEAFTYNEDLGMVDGRENLWRAVLMQTIAEASGKVVSGLTPAGRALVIAEARDYILKPNRDFNEVCSLAGLDPDAVREGVKRQLGDDPAAPAPDKPENVEPAASAPTLRRINGKRTVGEMSLTLREWANYLGITPNALSTRIHRLGSLEAVIERHGTTTASHGKRATASHADAQRVTFNGETLTVAEWAERIGVNRQTLIVRLRRWPIERALTEPLHSRMSRNSQHRGRPGVVINLPPVVGTGAGSVACEISEIDFSEKANAE